MRVGTTDAAPKTIVLSRLNRVSMPGGGVGMTKPCSLRLISAMRCSLMPCTGRRVISAKNPRMDLPDAHGNISQKLESRQKLG